MEESKMTWNNGIKTFKAGEALEARRRVKIESGTTNDPPEVVYADAGEDYEGITEYAVADGEMVACKLKNAPGTFEVECLVDSAIARGTVLYGADDGMVSDASSGSAQFTAMETGVDNAHIECLPHNVKSTTAATVSVADSGGHTANTTVEAVVAELFVHLKSAQSFIPLKLTDFREVGSNDIQNLAAHGGILAKDSTPILEYTNGDTDSALRLRWAASDSNPIVAAVPLPPNLNDAANLVVHFRAAMAGATDTPVIDCDSHFNEGDTKVEDASAAVTGTSFAEYTITIAAADVPAGAQTVTLELTPAAHTTDALYVTAIWLEYTGTILAS
jgi:hypothetical protein